MRDSSNRLGSAHALLACLVLAGGGLVQAQAPVRLVDLIDVSETDRHVDIILQFNCSLVYAGHSPTSNAGSELRLRLRPSPDCGRSNAAQFPLEMPLVSGVDGVVSSARVEPDAVGELALTLTFAETQTFVLAQGSNPRGLRIRLLRPNSQTSRILVTEQGDSASQFAVNLDSRPEPFERVELERVASQLQLPIFVSTADIGGETWHRLRAGPFDRRSVAEEVLRSVAPTYPKAWLAIGDDAVTSDPNLVFDAGRLPPVEPVGADPAIEPSERDSLLEEARSAMRAKNHERVIQILTKLQRQPEFDERSEVQELLGLARERSGQIAHAQAEYEEYLRRYPQGPAANRVQTRLRTLRAATEEERARSARSLRAKEGWNFRGGITQLYRRDSFGTEATGDLVADIVQDSVVTDVDAYAFRDGERLDMAARFGAGYLKNLLDEDEDTGAEDLTRVTTAYFDVSDRLLGLKGRLGRQTHTSDGVLGTFDGVRLSYELTPSWSIRGILGYPLERTEDGPRTDREFSTLAVGYGPQVASWDVSAFLTTQQLDGVRDRQAVGLQFRHFTPTRSIVGLVDYDTFYSSVNAVVLLGTLQLPARWALTFDLEERNAPVLTTRNALIGQTATTIDELRQTFGLSDIFQLARDRTPTLSSYMVSARRPLGQRFEVIFDVFGTELGETPASGGLEALPASGLALSYQAQLIASSLLFRGDFNQMALRQDDTDTTRTRSFAFISRIPLFGAWRVSPRLLISQRTQKSTGASHYLYTPTARIDYQRDGKLIELEGGAEIGDNDAALNLANTLRLYIHLGYRWTF